MMEARLAVVAALFCAVMSGPARAQELYATSFLQVYDEQPPTRMLGVGILDMGYSTQMYYDMSMSVSLRTMSDPWGFDYNVYSGQMVTWLGGSSSLEYDPTREYETEMQPSVLPYFRNEDGAFVDHYFYGTYLDGVPVLWPGGGGAYPFYGPGPEITTNYYSIVVGTLNSIFSGGAPHGPPDHVKVLADDTNDDSCNTKSRILKFQVVDSQGRRVGRGSVEEQFFNTQNGIQIPFVWNRCRNENISPSTCAPDDPGSTFQDKLWVGCPTVGGDCGVGPVIARWRWCPRNRTAVTLTTNTYEAWRDRVHVNGVARYSPGTHLH